jgi:hypothetical protein
MTPFHADVAARLAEIGCQLMIAMIALSDCRLAATG